MNNELFLESKTSQYGNHMVMTNVHKPTKTKYINIDTRFRDEYNKDDYSNSQQSNYNITIPERVNDVKSMNVKSVEIPISFFNISSNIGNNSFKVNNTVVTIADGQYNSTTIVSAINAKISAASILNLTFSLNSQSTNSIFTSSGATTFNITFAINTDGTPDKYHFKSKLGWLLGFRNPSYKFTTSIVSEAFLDLNGPRYLYLAVEEFNKGNQNSFVTPIFTSLVNKNIIARISLDNTLYGFGKVLIANEFNGYLLSDNRSYTGKIDLLKLNVQILDENGKPLVLNGLDFSFCVKVEHE